ncbi:DUF305 domain-containing protein [Streptomyces sp. YIM 98790]|uniref:DUF305 domain-containing protein n=1 Tax=Streptomyces sp. YIM 98790 TaxID=2689077 RepID=UPI00140955C4|nr:DUF305 domain-containing protein [Streptomyces sp. YIM 98790]
MTRPGPRGRLIAAGGAVALVVLAAVLLAAARLPGSGDRPPGQDSADAGFARDMAVHHQQAVELSFIVRDRTDDPEVRRLAYDIINTQANQRGMLLALLESWDLPVVSADPPMAWMDHTMDGGMSGRDGGALMPGMATEEKIDALRRAEGTDAEIRYLQLLTEHHRAGVHMAQAAADQAQEEQITGLAEGMVRGQESEITLMAAMLTDRGAAPSG